MRRFNAFSTRLLIPLASACLLLGFPEHSTAQHLLFKFEGSIAGGQFGHAIASAGDVNDDGTPDILIGAPLDDGGGVESGAVFVYSGADGILLHALCGDTPGDHFGWSVDGLGDVNGDGHGDFAVGAPDDDNFAPQSGSVYVFSGTDGAMLYRIDGAWTEYKFGWIVDRLADIDGDLKDDILVSVPYDVTFGVGSIQVLSGVDGTVLMSVYQGELGHAAEGFGLSVAAVSDSNSDTAGEVAIVSLQGASAHLDLFSGSTGASILALSGLGYTCGEGSTPKVAEAGDAIGGLSSLFMISYHEWCGADPYRLVEVREASVGAVVFSLVEGPSGQGGSRFGRALGGGGDRNGDGVPDFIVGAPYYDVGEETDAGKAYLFSGFDGSPVEAVEGTTAHDRLGSTVCFVGDLDGDGKDEYAIGAPYADPTGPNSGLVLVFGGCEAPPPANYCVTSANSVGTGATIDAFGSLSVQANDFTLSVESAVPGQYGLFFYGSEQTQVVFGEGFRCISAGTLGLFRLPAVQADVFGSASWPIDFTQPPVASGPGQITPGSVWNFQFWYRDPPGGPAGFNLSDGLEVTFCP